MTGLAIARRGATRRRSSAPAPTSWTQTNEVAALTDEWSSVDDTSGRFALTTTAAAVRTGTKGLQLGFTATSAAAKLTRTSLAFDGTTWRHDLYWRIPGALTISSYDTPILEGLNGGTLLWRLKITQDRGFILERYVPAYAQVGAYGIGTLTLNTWAKVSVQLTGGGSAAGGIAFLVNDAVVTSATGLNFTGTWKPDRLVLGTGALTGSGSIYFDDGLVAGS